MNKFLKNYWFLSLAITASTQVYAVQDVYEYKNSEGVTEFTDALKDDKTPEKHIQIDKMTPEQEAKSQKKLDRIMEKDKLLDERLAKERKLENEQRLAEQRKIQEANEKKQQENESNDGSNRYYDRGYYPGVPGRPVRPIVKPRPIQLPVR
ncbi:MAG: hypothetical protein GY694_01080 [Gammaproteobacteria bacterium]|nr:hypothetical protein [Gammaproteobacteria bacterium]